MGILSNFNVNMPESKIRQNYHEECEAMINKQINMEFYASYVYLSMGSYFNRQDQALHGFGKHFMGESEEERKHGIKLMEYQTKRGGRSSSRTSPNPALWSGGVLPRPWRLLWSSRKRSTRASWTCTSARTPRVTRTCATSWRPSISGSRWRGSRTSGTGSSRSSALETVWVCILWTRRLEVKYPLCVSSPHIGKLFNSRQNYLLSF